MILSTYGSHNIDHNIIHDINRNTCMLLLFNIFSCSKYTLLQALCLTLWGNLQLVSLTITQA